MPRQVEIVGGASVHVTAWGDDLLPAVVESNQADPAVHGDDSILHMLNLRRRWQISAAARQQSCRAKHELRACPTPRISAIIVEQALRQP
jgi:hypothetical protein